jgi:hypothetical protein
MMTIVDILRCCSFVLIVEVFGFFWICDALYLICVKKRSCGEVGEEFQRTQKKKPVGIPTNTKEPSVQQEVALRDLVLVTGEKKCNIPRLGRL